MNVSIYMNQNNYVCINDTKHIFINFDRKDLVFIETGGVRQGRLETVHIFITEFYTINKYFQLFVKKYGGQARIVIHIPYMVRVMKDGIRALLDCSKYQLHIDTSNVVYTCGDEKNDCVFVNIGTQHVWIQLPKLPINIYHQNFKYRLFKEDNSGMYLRKEWKLEPSKYKDAIIRQFKKVCPSKLLLAFPSEEAIWEYISRNHKEEKHVSNDSRSDVSGAIGSNDSEAQSERAVD